MRSIIAQTSARNRTHALAGSFCLEQVKAEAVNFLSLAMARTEPLMPLLEEHKSCNPSSVSQSDLTEKIDAGDQYLDRDKCTRSLSFAMAARPSICATVLITIPIAVALCSAGVFLLVLFSQWPVEHSGNATVIVRSANQQDILFGTALQSSPSYRKEPQIVEADHGVVAADDGRCSLVGRNVLRDGGNAVDAAVATTLCLGVVSPESSGIGGGGFMLVRMSTGKTIAYDMRETAPGASSEDMYEQDPNSKAVGALSIGVPGEIAGLYLAWQGHGKLPWKRLVYPAIRFADKGFKVSPYLATKIEGKADLILAYPGLKEFLAPNGTLLGVGDVCYRRKLANTLALVAKYGPRAFYKGSIAAKLVKDVHAAGGILTLQDLSSYQVKVRRALQADVMGYTVLGMPPPSSGGAAIILILDMLSNYQMPCGIQGTLGLHRMIEAFKHAYAIRMDIGDPEFVNVTGVINEMLSSQFAAMLQKRINDTTTFPPDYYTARWSQLNDHGTSHISIVDRERNAVSLTSTVNSVFGSYIVSSSTGILLNNEMDDFAIPSDIGTDGIPPAKANFIRPYKRPLSAMAPTIVLKNGQVAAVTGGAGGAKIITATTSVLLNYLFKGMDPFESVASPRVHHQLVPNVVQYENWTVVTGDHIELSGEDIASLKEKGHELEGKASGAIIQLVVQDFRRPVKRQAQGVGTSPCKLIGVSDLRKGGIPSGL